MTLIRKMGLLRYNLSLDLKKRLQEKAMIIDQGHDHNLDQGGVAKQFPEKVLKPSGLVQGNGLYSC